MRRAETPPSATRVEAEKQPAEVAAVFLKAGRDEAAAFLEAAYSFLGTPWPWGVGSRSSGQDSGVCVRVFPPFGYSGDRTGVSVAKRSLFLVLLVGVVVAPSGCGGDKADGTGSLELDCAVGDDCASGVCLEGTCVARACGDGVVQDGEACDGGGESASCNVDCTMSSCGDGVLNVTASEACDDGGESASCNADCTVSSCGDGVLNATANEACDDGGESASCNADCTVSSCGDGVLNVTASEACDDGGESASCNADCTVSSCGDGVLNVTASEACDDGGESASCNADCTVSSCGDGVLNATANEACDDGGESASCNADCTVSSCGDGVLNVTANEACDDGGESASCNADCTVSSCGDGVLNVTASEACDDGGESASCNADCTVSSCGDGVLNVTASEACDDGGESASCNADCTVSSCGDGVLNVTANEECDDGNIVPADGCDDQCLRDSMFVFVTSTTHTGDLGGLLGADAICNQLAYDAGLPGTYMAWLGSSVEGTPSSRFTPSAAPYVLVDETVVADNWSDLVDASIDAPISLTELGTPAPTSIDVCGSTQVVWSGANPFGDLAADSDRCADWTDSAGQASWGDASAMTSGWANFCFSTAPSCDLAVPFYCFQQTR